VRLSDHQAQFTQDLANLIRMAPSIMPGYRVRLSYAERSMEEQERLHAANPRGAAPAGRSQHNVRLAADLILDKRGEDGRWVYQTDTRDYAPLGHQWERMSIWNRWGGRFNDGNHFERREITRDEPSLIA
jgi:hypothetical protein